jgi:hypothetical protein
MNPAKGQDQALRRRSGDSTSLEQALFRNIQQNQNGPLPIVVSPFLLQRAQPMSLEKLHATLQAALDLTESEDLDLNFEFEQEFEALERSLRG